MAVTIDDRLPLERRVFSVNTTDMLFDHLSPLIVLRYDHPGRNDHEDEYHLLPPFRMSFEELFKPAQPVRHPLGVVKPVDGKNDLPTLEVRSEEHTSELQSREN